MLQREGERERGIEFETNQRNGRVYIVVGTTTKINTNAKTKTL